VRPATDTLTPITRITFLQISSDAPEGLYENPPDDKEANRLQNDKKRNHENRGGDPVVVHEVPQAREMRDKKKMCRIRLQRGVGEGHGQLCRAWSLGSEVNNQGSSATE
jgi:hypothetical protein